MVKPPPIERFKLSCEVDAAQLGPTLAIFTKMGLTNLDFELITDVRTFNKVARPEIRSQDLLAEWVKDHPTFKATEVVKMFDADGRSKGAVYPAIAALVEKGILKKLSPGNYTRADVKQIAAKSSASTNKYAISNGDFILRAARRAHGRINTTSLRKLFEADGRMSSSISPTLNTLVTSKVIKRVGEGEYELRTKATPKPKTPTSPTQPVANGHAVEASING